MTTSHNLSFPYQPKEHDVPSLSDDFLNALIAEIDTVDIVGITLAGSHIRGDATQFSDVDLACWVPDMMKQPLKRMVYRNGHLVSIGFKKGVDVRRSLTLPYLAIWVGASLQTPGVRRTLLDKDGSVTALMHDIATFRWEPLQGSANFFASDWLMLMTEMAHKVLSELTKDNDLGIAYACEKLLSHLTEVVAVQRGVMIKTDSTYYQQVEEAAGLDSDWTTYHRQVAGVDIPSNMHPVKARGIAALHLYRETVKLLWDILVPEHREVIEQTLDVIGDV
jgi:hypothetical protein